MASSAEKDAVLAYGPVVKNAADSTGTKGVFREAATTTAQTDTTPSSWKGAWVNLMARGTVVQFGFVLEGDTAPTLVIDQAAVFGTGHAAAGYTILEDTEKAVLVPPNAKQIVWICSSANAGEFFEGHLAGPLKGR